MTEASRSSEQSAAGVDGCPKCFNEHGFAFGTCIECGWNYLDSSYHWIVVYQPSDAFDVAEHDRRVIERRSLRGAR